MISVWTMKKFVVFVKKIWNVLSSLRFGKLKRNGIEENYRNHFDVGVTADEGLERRVLQTDPTGRIRSG